MPSCYQCTRQHVDYASEGYDVLRLHSVRIYHDEYGFREVPYLLQLQGQVRGCVLEKDGALHRQD